MILELEKRLQGSGLSELLRDNIMAKSKNYEYLSHAADIKFRAYGKTMARAFDNAAYALTDVMTDHTKVKALKTKKIVVESEDEKALLYDFLEQFLILADSEGFLLHKVNSLEISGEKKKRKLTLTAEVVGDNKMDKYPVETHIKAITYEDMLVDEEKDGFILQVIIDI